MRTAFHPAPLIAVLAALLLACAVFGGGRVPAPSDFVEVSSLDPTILVDLPYATERNFTGRVLYPVARCYLRREVAEALVAAHRSLGQYGVGIKIWDGYRPRSVQYRMWETAPKPGYVGDPKIGSKHNRGAAVDVTLYNLASREELEMPTPYDEFSLKAHSAYEALPHEVLERRKLLQETMRAHGFSTIRNEWWHFDFWGWENFSLEDVPIEEFAKRDDEAERARMETWLQHGPQKPEAKDESALADRSVEADDAVEAENGERSAGLPQVRLAPPSSPLRAVPVGEPEPEAMP